MFWARAGNVADANNTKRPVGSRRDFDFILKTFH